MLAASLLLLSVLLAPPAARPPTGARLREHCRAGAADPLQPWALAHGLALDGRAFRARDGRPATEVIVSDFLRADGTFPSTTPTGIPVEPHPSLQLKSLLLAGIAPAHRFQTPHGPVRLTTLVERLTHDFRRDAALTPEGAWTLDALSHALGPQASFTTGAGVTEHVDALMDDALRWLEHEEAGLLAGMRAGQAQVPKDRRGLYAHPCGGLHFVQAVLSHARHPAVRAAWGARLDTQVDVLLYRLASESRQYDDALADTPPGRRLPLLAQMLKFYGHWLETLGRYRDETGWTPTPSQLDAVRQAGALLEGTVRRLEAAEAWHASLPWEFLGDTCHAARGWRDWSRVLGEARVRP